MAYVQNTSENSSMGIFLGLLVGIVIAVLLVVGVRSFGVLDGTENSGVNIELPSIGNNPGTNAENISPENGIEADGGTGGTLTQ